MGKTADQFQSCHQEGGTLLCVVSSSAMLRRLIPTFAHIRIVMLCQKGLSSREVSRRLSVNHGGGTEIQELSMICVAQATQRLLLQLMTATCGFQLGGIMKAMPQCRIMLFVQPQDVLFTLKLYKIGCMMCNFTPDVHARFTFDTLNAELA